MRSCHVVRASNSQRCRDVVPEWCWKIQAVVPFASGEVVGGDVGQMMWHLDVYHCWVLFVESTACVPGPICACMLCVMLVLDA